MSRSFELGKRQGEKNILRSCSHILYGTHNEVTLSLNDLIVILIKQTEANIHRRLLNSPWEIGLAESIKRNKEWEI